MEVGLEAGEELELWLGLGDAGDGETLALWLWLRDGVALALWLWLGDGEALELWLRLGDGEALVLALWLTGDGDGDGTTISQLAPVYPLLHTHWETTTQPVVQET
jgi:hypothetical protein